MLMPKKNLLLPKMLRLRGQLPPASYVYANVLSINL